MARQGSRAVWFTEALTVGGPSWMVGAAAGDRGVGLAAGGSVGPEDGRVGRWAGKAHSLWISTWKATLVLPAALRAVQL